MEDPSKKTLPASKSELQTAADTLPESSLRNRKKSDNIRGVEPRGNESKRPVKPDVQQSAADEARNTVRSAVESNPVLSNLFGKNKSSATEKEKRDALFTRNC